MPESLASDTKMSSSGTRDILRVTHRTRYLYEEPVSHSLHLGLLTPRMTRFQTLVSSHVSTDPQFRSATAHQDYYGNQVTLMTIDRAHRKLQVEAQSVLAIEQPRSTAFPDPPPGLGFEAVRARIRRPESGEDLRAAEFAFDSPHVRRNDAFAGYASVSFSGRQSVLHGAHALMHRIHREFHYDPAVTTVSTPVAEVFRQRAGVCQDFAHFMIACLRSLGLAARYVSGYIVPGPSVVGAQASHAWLAVYSPDSGWTDFDPTNDIVPSGHHITLAWGRDYSDVSPFRGVVAGGGKHEVSVEVSVASES